MAGRKQAVVLVKGSRHFSFSLAVDVGKRRKHITEGVITALEVQQRNKKRVNVFLNDVYAFSLSLDEAVKLRKGQVLSEADIIALQGLDDLQRAVDAGARFLSYRPRSEQEVRRKLAEKGIVPEIIERAIERLKMLGYIDDHAFTAFWINERNTFKPVSPRALRHELREKGVPDDVINTALADVDAEEAAYRAAQMQARRLRNVTRKQFHEKLTAVLQRRGFNFSTAKAVIKRLQAELEEADAEAAANGRARFFAVDGADEARDDWEGQDADLETSEG